MPLPFTINLLHRCICTHLKAHAEIKQNLSQIQLHLRQCLFMDQGMGKLFHVAIHLYSAAPFLNGECNESCSRVCTNAWRGINTWEKLSSPAVLYRFTSPVFYNDKCVDINIKHWVNNSECIVVPCTATWMTSGQAHWMGTAIELSQQFAESAEATEGDILTTDTQ